MLRTTALDVMILSFFFLVPPKPQLGKTPGADSTNRRLEPLFGCKGFMTQFLIELQIGKHWKLCCEEASCTSGMNLQDCSVGLGCACISGHQCGVEWEASVLEVWGIYPLQEECHFTEAPVQFFTVVGKHHSFKCVISMTVDVS